MHERWQLSTWIIESGGVRPPAASEANKLTVLAGFPDSHLPTELWCLGDNAALGYCLH